MKTLLLLLLASQAHAGVTLRPQDFPPFNFLFPSSGTFAGSLTVQGPIVATGTVTASQFVGYGGALTGVAAASAASVPASGITAGTLAAGVIEPVANIDLSTFTDALKTKLSSGAIPSQFVNLSTVTDAIALKVSKAGDTMTGALNMSGNLINNVADPFSAQDVATKNYVDSSTTTKVLPTKVPARLGTTAALPSNTYNNGASGVGATLTGLGLGQITIDGATPNVGDRILVNNEATAANNGIYVVNVNGAGLFYQFTRVADFNSPFEMVAGDALFVTSGTVNTDAFFVLLASVTTVGTDPINFVQANGLGDVTAGNGLSKSGNTISLASTVTVQGNAFSVGGTTFSIASGVVFVGTTTNVNASTVTILGDANATTFTETFSTFNATSGSSYNVNWSSGGIHHIVLTANCTFTFSNLRKAQTITLWLRQDATGSRTVTWPSNIDWSGSAPTLTTTAAKTDEIFLTYDGVARFMGDVSLNH